MLIRVHKSSLHVSCITSTCPLSRLRGKACLTEKDDRLSLRFDSVSWAHDKLLNRNASQGINTSFRDLIHINKSKSQAGAYIEDPALVKHRIETHEPRAVDSIRYGSSKPGCGR